MDFTCPQFLDAYSSSSTLELVQQIGRAWQPPRPMKVGIWHFYLLKWEVGSASKGGKMFWVKKGASGAG